MEFNFTPSIDKQPGVLFEPSSWLVKIDFINQFITNNHVLISILGEKGSGKTTFIDILKRKLNSDIEAVIWTAVPLFDRNACLQQLASSFDLKNLTSLDELKKIIDERQTETLLIIDDAEQLSEAFICEILDTIRSQSEHTYFHICLVSDFSLVKTTSKLARETYKEMIHSIELQPLSQQETKDYVIDRLKWDPEQADSIPQDRFKQFYDLTEGNLVGINSQINGFFSKQKSNAVSSPRRYFSYGLAVITTIAVVGFSFFIHHQTQPLNQPINTAQDTALKNSIDTAKVEIELPYPSQIPPFDVASIRQSLEVMEPQETLTLVNDEQNQNITQPKSFPDEPIKVKANMEVKDKNQVIHVQNNIQQLKSAKIQKTNPTAKSSHYTIQLLAGRNADQVRKFLKKHQQLKNTHILKFTQNGTVWYVLTTGEYAYKQAAQSALVNISKNLHDVKPWVRTMDHLKRIG